MGIELRDYQQECVDSLFEYMGRRNGNPLLVLPTGAGKSVIQSAVVSMATEHPCRVLCITHSKELIEQNYKAFVKFDSVKGWQAGINSAGLNRRDYNKSIIFGGIQSVHNKAKRLGAFDLIIVDECHMIPHKDSGTYRKFLNAMEELNPNVRIVGLTATPYRLSGGVLTKGATRLFDSICYEVDVLMLIKRGFLTPLTTRKGSVSYDTSKVTISGGEFNQVSLSDAIEGEDAATVQAVEEIVELGKDRKSWLLFCTSVKHAELVRDILNGFGITCALVTGETDKSTRKQATKDLIAGKLRCIVNVNVLTTGFDAPIIDLIGLMRPTQSPGLYVQMLGRGMRLYDGKADCMVLDYGGNIDRHGPINKIKPPPVKGKGGGVAVTKDCPTCQFEGIAAGKRQCPECGFEFPEPESKVQTTASDSEIISESHLKWFDVADVRYSIHNKADKPPSLRVDYLSGLGNKIASEWVCVAHGGFAQQKAEQWIDMHLPADCMPPTTAQDALEIAHLFPRPSRIEVNDSGQFDRIENLDYAQDVDEIDDSPITFTEKEQAALPDPYTDLEFYDDDLPF